MEGSSGDRKKMEEEASAVAAELEALSKLLVSLKKAHAP